MKDDLSSKRLYILKSANTRFYQKVPEVYASRLLDVNVQAGMPPSDYLISNESMCRVSLH